MSNLERHTQYRARFIECGTSASVSLDGKWQIYFGKNANPMVLHLSGMLCQSPRHARAPPRTRHPCNRRPRGCRLRIFARTDGLTLFICSYLNMLVWMCSCLHAPTLFCPCGIYQSGTSTSLLPDGMLVVNLRWGEDAPDMVTPHLSRKHVHLQFQCFGMPLGGRRILGTDVAELSGRQVPTSMPRSHG